MNPIIHQQLAQSTHVEYEARYGNQARVNNSQQEKESLFSGLLGRHKLVLSGLSVQQFEI